MATYATTAIVLRQTDFREASQLFHFYTREYGKVEAVARGSKKIKSKLRGHLEPFGIVRILVAHGKRIDQLAGAAIQDGFQNIARNLEKIGVASFGIELVDRLTKPGSPDPEIFDLLADFLATLDQENLTRAKINAYQDAFALKLLGLLGLHPEPRIAKNSAKLRDFLREQLDREVKSLQFISSLTIN